MKTHDPLTAFDLGPVLDWLEANRAKIAPRMEWLNEPGPMYTAVKDGDKIHLDQFQISNVIGLFPEGMRQNSTLAHIQGRDTTWFIKGMTSDNPRITTSIGEALYPRAFVPGHTDLVKWDDNDKQQFIELYHLPGVSHDVAAWMTAHALIHEFVHTLISPLWYTKTWPRLRIPGHKEKANVATFLAKFAMAASKCPPMSHYSAAQRPLPHDCNHPEFIVRVGEELCESVVAYFQGFIYCEEVERQFEPFVDRPEVLQLVEDFINAVPES